MTIPAQIYEVFCPHCGGRVEYPLFQASFYDFATYQECETAIVVRVDLQGVDSVGSPTSELLRSYAEKRFPGRENLQWIDLAKENICKSCKNRFLTAEGRDHRLCLEEQIEAETIP